MSASTSSALPYRERWRTIGRRVSDEWAKPVAQTVEGALILVTVVQAWRAGGWLWALVALLVAASIGRFLLAVFSAVVGIVVGIVVVTPTAAIAAIWDRNPNLDSERTRFLVELPVVLLIIAIVVLTIAKLFFIP